MSIKVNPNHIPKPPAFTKKLRKQVDKGVKDAFKRRGLDYGDLYGDPLKKQRKFLNKT